MVGVGTPLSCQSTADIHARRVAAALPLSAAQVMIAVVVVEIAAGVLVALRPRVGGYVVAAWLATIVVNLLLLGDVYDVSLRDFGLLLGALALARLAAAFPGTGFLGTGPGEPARA